MHLIRMAHSLGYFHPKQMLDGLDARDYIEVMMSLRLKSEKKKDQERRIQEIKTKRFLDQKIREQK